jgi:hypothetical protein
VVSASSKTAITWRCTTTSINAGPIGITFDYSPGPKGSTVWMLAAGPSVGGFGSVTVQKTHTETIGATPKVCK